MNTREMFEETSEIGKRIANLMGELDQLNKKYLEIIHLCPHEIVFKYRDDFPKEMNFDGYYFCPSCGQYIRCSSLNQINNTKFNDSIIIPLTSLSLVSSEKIHQVIREEVYNNIKFYYNPNTPISDMSYRMEEILKDYEKHYERPTNVLKKIKK